MRHDAPERPDQLYICTDHLRLHIALLQNLDNAGGGPRQNVIRGVVGEFSCTPQWEGQLMSHLEV